jgi:hypothetical protein
MVKCTLFLTACRGLLEVFGVKHLGLSKNQMLSFIAFLLAKDFLKFLGVHEVPYPCVYL